MAGRPRPGEAVPLIFVDSSVWIDYFNGSDTPATERLHALLGREPLIVGDIVVTEVLQGFRRDRDFRMARDVLKTMEERFGERELRPSYVAIDSFSVRGSGQVGDRRRLFL